MSLATLFLDTEFIPGTSPRLLSLALTDGAEFSFHAALEPDAPALAAALARANAVVRNDVVPQLRRGGVVVADEAALGQTLFERLSDAGLLDANVAYDYHTDFDLLESVLRQAGRWPELQTRLVPTHVGYLLGDEAAQAAMQRSWAHSAQQGLLRHHALADARALAAAYAAVHGSA